MMKAPIFLVGATGVGKTAAAMELARRNGAAILAMDAIQVYRGADIGTGKPSAEERAEVSQAGMDLAEFGEAFDVARYLEFAKNFLSEQQAQGRQIIIVGGTGLYFRALTRGLCRAPQGSVRLRTELEKLSIKELRQRLERLDPEMATRIDGANSRRLMRAIEVMEETGRSLRAWQEETPEPLITEYRAFWIQRSKSELEDRIATRVEAMFAAGWREEVRELAERFGWEAVRKFAGIGYREIAELENSSDGGPGSPLQTEAAVKSNIIVATRQYAKRQLTWFRREPNLVQVMLSGSQALSATLPFLS